MHITSSRPRLWVLLLGIAVLALSGLAAAEPPSRAARLSSIKGTVSFSPAGQPDWVQAVVNRPLTTGDALWTDDDSRAELQLGGAAIRLGSTTSLTLLNLDDHIAQMQLSQGTLKIRVRRLGSKQSFEVDTPNLAFTLRRAGEYRIDVDASGDATAVRIQSGEAEVYGEGTSYRVDSRQGYRFYGTGLSDYDLLAARHDDELDTWAHERDSRSDYSPSARFVSPDVVGYEDLDANGTWRDDPDFGNVWTPTHVAAGWTPYHDGHWAWVDPWGWTWVDDAPWGFAVSHYGRWANIKGSWGWVPGPPREQAVYAPALVAFVGGKNLQVSLSVGSAVAAVVGWFPLAPREVYRPSYPVSRGYFDNINRSNAVIAPTTITKVYNTTNVTNNTTIINNNTNVNVTKVVYVNQQVSGAVVAVPAQSFVQSQPVAKAAVAVSKQAATTAPVGNVAVVAPVQQSIHGGAASAKAKPPAQALAVVAHTAPPPAPVAFAVQQQQLAAKPGLPIDEAQRKQLKPVASPTPKVSVVATVKAAAPTVAPPATPPAGKSPEARKADAAKIDAAKAYSTKGESIKTDTPKAEAAKVDPVKADAAKMEAAKTDTAKADADKAEAVKAEANKAATAKSEAVKADAAKAEASKADAVKAEAEKAATAKTEAAKADSAKAEVIKADAAKAEANKAATAKAKATKADAARAEASKADAVKAEAVKAATAKAEAEKADAAKVEANKAEAAKAEAAKAATAKAEAVKVDAAKAEASKADAVKAEAAKANAAKAEANKADAAKAEAAKAAATNAEAVKAAKAKSDALLKADEEKKKAEEEARKRKPEVKCDSAQANCTPKKGDAP